MNAEALESQAPTSSRWPDCATFCHPREAPICSPARLWVTLHERTRMDDDQQATDERSGLGMPPLLVALAPALLFAVLAGIVASQGLHPAIVGVVALLAAAIPIWMLARLAERAARIEDSVRRLVRGEMARPLPSVDDEALGPVADLLEQLRRQLVERVRES